LLDGQRILLADRPLHRRRRQRSQAGDRGSRVSGRGCGQPGRRDHSPGQIQEFDPSAAALAQKKARGGAGHWVLQARQHDGSLLAQGTNRRCGARGTMRGRLQHPLTAARNGVFGPEGPFCACAGVAGFGSKPRWQRRCERENRADQRCLGRLGEFYKGK